jgi:ketosteroid isomerase-like protein
MVCFGAMERISPEQVRAHVEEFWNALCGRSPGSFERLYAPDATVISGRAKRSTSARLIGTRREREIAEQLREGKVELGPINVEVVQGDVAIASYTYKFTRVRKRGGAGDVQRHTPFGRATHVIQRDASGVLRIVHEHLSSAVPAAVEAVNASLR